MKFRLIMLCSALITAMWLLNRHPEQLERCRHFTVNMILLGAWETFSLAEVTKDSAHAGMEIAVRSPGLPELCAQDRSVGNGYLLLIAGQLYGPSAFRSMLTSMVIANLTNRIFVLPVMHGARISPTGNNTSDFPWDIEHLREFAPNIISYHNFMSRTGHCAANQTVEIMQISGSEDDDQNIGPTRCVSTMRAYPHRFWHTRHLDRVNVTCFKIPVNVPPVQWNFIQHLKATKTSTVALFSRQSAGVDNLYQFALTRHIPLESTYRSNPLISACADRYIAHYFGGKSFIAITLQEVAVLRNHLMRPRFPGGVPGYMHTLVIRMQDAVAKARTKLGADTMLFVSSDLPLLSCSSVRHAGFLKDDTEPDATNSTAIFCSTDLDPLTREQLTAISLPYETLVAQPQSVVLNDPDICSDIILETDYHFIDFEILLRAELLIIPPHYKLGLKTYLIEAREMLDRDTVRIPLLTPTPVKPKNPA